MDLEEYRRHDAVGLAGLVNAGEVKPGELLDCALEAADRLGPSLNALIARFDDAARAEVDAGLPDGPLRGVPFVVKDLVTDVAGVATTNGCRLFADAVASRDAELTTRYRRAGLVPFAKSNTPEFGLSPTTEPALFGPTRNPWALDRTPGGSSGGSAAAVAAGIVPIGHASDGGGSIRIPASCCGLFGLKPSRGRTPFGPVLGEGWSGMSVHHVLSRSVRDSAVALDATAGPAPGDPYAAPPKPESYLDEVTADPGRIRVGLCLEPAFDVPVDPVCASAAESVATLCEELGHDVDTTELPPVSDAIREAQMTLVPANVAASIDARLAELGRESADDDIEAVTRMIAELGRGATAARYAAALRNMHRVGRAFGELFERIDVLLTPTLALPPVKLGTFDMSDVETYMVEVPTFPPFTPVANVTGQPAMSVPLTVTDGLPIGSHFVGRYGDEHTLLRLAGQLERAAPWADRLPVAIPTT